MDFPPVDEKTASNMSDASEKVADKEKKNIEKLSKVLNNEQSTDEQIEKAVNDYNKQKLDNFSELYDAFTEPLLAPDGRRRNQADIERKQKVIEKLRSLYKLKLTEVFDENNIPTRNKDGTIAYEEIEVLQNRVW